MGDAAGEEAVIDALHEHRTAAAMALLNQYNPQWFPDPGMGGLANTDEASADGGSGSSGSGDVDRDVDDDGEGGRKSAASTHVSPAGDERQRAAAAVARQRAAAMALLNEHNSDWFGGARPGEKKSPTTTTTKRKSLLRMIGKGRKSNNTATYNNSNTSMSRRGSFSVLADVTSSDRPTPTPTPTATIAPSPRSLSIRMGIRSESPPTSTIRHSMGRLSLRSATKGAKTQKAVSGQAVPGSSSSDKPKKHRGSSPWFSRHGSGLSASSCPATPADAGVHRGITARSPEVDDNPGHGKKGESISSGVRRSSPTPTIQAPLMDVLENKSQEPMSLRSMLRFARENLMEENVLFYLEVVSFKTGGGGQGEYLTHLKRIQELYIQTASPREVNISGDIRASTLRSVESILTDTGNAIGAGNSSVVSSAACELSHGNGDVSDEEPDDGLGNRSEETQSMPLGPQETRVDAEEFCASMDARLPAAAAAAEADSAGPTAATTTTTKPPETRSEIVETIWRDGDANREATSDAGEEVAERHSNHGRLSQPSIYPLASTLTPAPPLPPRPPIPTPVLKATVVADFTTTTAAASVTEAAADGVVLAPDVGRTDAAQEGQSQNSPVDPAGASEKPIEEATAGAEDEGGTVTGGAASSASKGANGSGSGTEGGRGGRESEEGSKQRGEEKGEGEDEDWKCRERDCAMSWDDCAGSSAGAAGREGHFDVSMEIEQLGLSIGPGGGYGDRSIFDSALLEIFVLLRHEVYPKFVARVMKRSRGMMTAANASTSISSAGSTRSTTPDSSARSMGEQPAPWSQSDEGGKPRRFSFSRRR